MLPKPSSTNFFHSRREFRCTSCMQSSNHHLYLILCQQNNKTLCSLEGLCDRFVYNLSIIDLLFPPLLSCEYWHPTKESTCEVACKLRKYLVTFIYKHIFFFQMLCKCNTNYLSLWLPLFVHPSSLYNFVIKCCIRESIPLMIFVSWNIFLHCFSCNTAAHQGAYSLSFGRYRSISRGMVASSRPALNFLIYQWFRY